MLRAELEALICRLRDYAAMKRFPAEFVEDLIDAADYLERLKRLADGLRDRLATLEAERPREGR